MEVLGGVTLVVMASVAGIQDGDAYNSLLQCATILNGRCLLQFCVDATGAHMHACVVPSVKTENVSVSFFTP